MHHYITLCYCTSAKIISICVNKKCSVLGCQKHYSKVFMKQTITSSIITPFSSLSRIWNVMKFNCCHLLRNALKKHYWKWDEIREPFKYYFAELTLHPPNRSKMFGLKDKVGGTVFSVLFPNKRVFCLLFIIQWILTAYLFPCLQWLSLGTLVSN